MDFVVPANHRVKIKESEKIDKYLDLARKLRMLPNLRMMVIPIVIGALGTVHKDWKGDWKSGKLLWEHILPYPKDGLVQSKHILRASSLGEDNFSFLTRHLTDRSQAENGYYFVCMTSFFCEYHNVYLSPVVWVVLPPVLSEDHNRNRRSNRDHPDYSIVEIDLNTEKSSGYLREALSHSDSSEKPSINAGGKKLALS